MGRGEEIDPGVPGEHVNVGVFGYGFEQGDLNGVSCCICGVHDARQRVASFQRQVQAVVRLAVERHFQLLHQQILDQVWTLVRKQFNRFGVAVPGASPVDIFRQQLRGIAVSPSEHDPALRPIGIGIGWFLGAGDQGDVYPGFCQF